MTAYLYSVNPYEVAFHAGEFGGFAIPAATAENGGVGVLPVADRQTWVDHGDDRKDAIPYPATKLCPLLVQDNPGHGVGWGETPRPSHQQLEALREEYRRVAVERVQKADSRWNETHNRTLITDADRAAAQFLDMKPEWSDVHLGQRMKECPFCRASVRAEAVFCPTCRLWLDGRPDPSSAAAQVSPSPQPPARATR